MIKFKRLDENGKLPRRSTDGSAGFDIYAAESVNLWINGQAVIKTSIACEIPEGYAGFIWPRSGMAIKHVVNTHAGLIDSDFRGEIKVCLINHGDRTVEIRKGDRIAQMVVSPYLGEAIEVDELSDSERGTGAFGSTGV